MYMFENAFAPNFNFGYGSAIAWMLFLLIIIVAVVNVALIRRTGRSGKEGCDMTSVLRPPRQAGRGGGTGLWSAGRLTYFTLIVACAFSVFPIYWMVVVATRTNDATGQLPPALLPGGNLPENASRLFGNDDANFLTGMVNSAIVAICVTVSVVLFSSLAGFAFAKLRFRGRNKLLLVIIATMAVPTQLGVILSTC
ncbi:hypothetical protein GCM10027614_01590 [Micromonospora vulcania]